MRNILNQFLRVCVSKITIPSVMLFLYIGMPGTSYASDCKVFLSYYNMAHPQPQKNHSELSSNTREALLLAIDSLPGNSTFSKLYKTKEKKRGGVQNEIGYLNCVYDYLSLDFDRDGMLDWTTVAQGQLLDMMIPNDKDWDNDGIINIYDSKPLEKNNKGVAINKIPQHLRLSKNNNDQLNRLQDLLFSECGVLAINYSDNHSRDVLDVFLKLCKASIQNKPKEGYNLVLYAFLSHTFASDVVASYYPELNAMSVGGQAFSKSLKVSQSYLIKMIAHEIGHFLVFNYLTPNELKSVACKYGNWKSREGHSTSFFDTFFLKPFTNKKHGYMPTSYSKSNIHEWFSEAFSEYLYNKVENKYKVRSQGLLALGFDYWISEKIKP